ncbi:peptidoglycan DD-metalloendopeptidase family protein [uncultured Formosa sp.]|uniref:peptidoglycan DD-metalloendopeptidase family protein n=1 Tax=uncultured Formosa sp. TaxID=255435 RepID=UPI0026210D33|nr:peptidoglycan DD-metalloendopeptidase family protein [uncultured Formosa sp.]
MFTTLIKSVFTKPIHVLAPEINSVDYVSLDLSPSNLDLKQVDVSSSEKLQEYIKLHLKHHNAKLAYGGYLEVRDIYKRSMYFNSDDRVTERNIHIGIDLWCEVGSSVLAALDGTVHSFKNNTNHGDYGPTIILKHSFSDFDFYTLYGHLSLDSIVGLQVGKTVKHGDKIGELGASNVNGDYPPHLHFQIIKDMQDYVGDYPGVCCQLDLEFYVANCPDPNLLLNLV